MCLSGKAARKRPNPRARQRRGRSLLLGAEGEHSANLSWSEGLTRNERKVKRLLRPDWFHRAEPQSGG